MKTKTKTTSKTVSTSLFALSLLTLMACGKAPVTSAELVSAHSSQGIVNGSAVEESDEVARSTAALYLKFPQGERVVQFCTATLIGKRTLTTAGHCLLAVSNGTGIAVEDLTPFLYVAFGLKKTNSLNATDVKFISLKAAVVHPEFKLDALVGANEQTAIPDIALLQLTEDAPSDYQPATLLRDEAKVDVGAELILAGYGLTKGPPEAASANELRRTEVKVLKAKYNPTQFSYEIVDGRTACSGDSGGPAFLASNTGSGLVLAGITSFGDNRCSILGVYTSVPAMIQWIDEQVALLDKPEDEEDPTLLAKAFTGR